MGKPARKAKQPARSGSTRGASSRRASASSRKGGNHMVLAAMETSVWAEAISLLLIATGVLLLWALCSKLSAEASNLAGDSGRLGGYLAEASLGRFGIPAFLLVAVCFVSARRVWKLSGSGIGQVLRSESQWLLACSGLLVGSSSFAAAAFGGDAGGNLGARIAGALASYLGSAGSTVLSATAILFFFSVLTGLSSQFLFSWLRTACLLLARLLGECLALTVRGLVAVVTASVAAAALFSAGFRRIFSLAVRHAEESVEESKRTRLLRQETAQQAEPNPKSTRASAVDDEDEADDDLDDEDEEEEDEYEDDDEDDEYEDEDEDDEIDLDEIELEEDDLDEDDLEELLEDDEELLTPQAAPLKILRRERREEAPAKAKRPVSESSAKSAAGKKAEADYVCPRLDLLVSTEGADLRGPKDDLLIANSRALEEALGNFRVGGHVVEVHPGPVITLYQFQPAAGVKVQRIINLADDLALALRVASVRVFAPVPGKGTVGIEVPNQHREMVRLRDVLETEEYQGSADSLPLALGKDTYGDPFVAYLPRMPHLLIAGATGTGKSVCINSILLSLLYKNTPKDLRLLMIDPKMLELSVYEDIPHLKAPVVTLAKHARGVLWWAVEEMERRYRLLKQLGVRDLASYNRMVAEQSVNNAVPVKKKKKEAVIELQEKDVIATGSPLEGLDRTADEFGFEDDPDTFVSYGADPLVPPREQLPRIVIVVDELADLMLTVGREIEELLARLAQKARAAGIHLILATQRPSVNVITGLIKANFPARISFKVASKIDARTVMDTSGAEKLLGMGDMLFMSPSVGQVKRLHSPYVSDQEVHDVVEWIRKQGAPDYDASIEEMINKVNEGESREPGEGGGEEDYDSFYDQAVTLVIDKGQASTSMVQRAFRIGYNRAARILETMEREGVVGPADGSKPRQVLVGSAQDNF